MLALASDYRSDKQAYCRVARKFLNLCNLEKCKKIGKT